MIPGRRSIGRLKQKLREKRQSQRVANLERRAELRDAVTRQRPGIRDLAHLNFAELDRHPRRQGR